MMTCLDFETTGSVKGWPNEPWQLGMVAVENGKVVQGSQRETFFQVTKERPFSPRAPGRWAQIREELAAAPKVMEIWPELAGLLVGRPLVAHNAATERTILERCAPMTAFGPWVDTLKLARRLWPLMRSYALGDIIGALGLGAEVDQLCPGRAWHDALYDACAGAVLLCHIMKILKVNNDADICCYA